MLAGQTIPAGDLTVEAYGWASVTVTYRTAGAWHLTQIHFWIGLTTADIPQTANGNPKVGQFPYTYTTDAQQYTFTISVCGN